LNYLQEMRLHSPSGQPVPVLHHPQRKEGLPQEEAAITAVTNDLVGGYREGRASLLKDAQ